MEILFFISVPSLGCLEALKARGILMSKVWGLGIP